MEESGEQCTVVFALIVTEPASEFVCKRACQLLLAVEGSGEQCIVVFALIVTETASEFVCERSLSFYWPYCMAMFAGEEVAGAVSDRG
jgi:hypothetical protein